MNEKRTSPSPIQNFCKRVTFQTSNQGEKPRVIYGVIEYEDEHELRVKTAKKLHRIFKPFVISIEDTTIIFDEDF